MKADWVGRWAGQTVVCIASGPSLTVDDCAAVQAAGLPAIVTNTTFRRCPWAEVLLAHDARWWHLHRAEVDAVFHGKRLTCSTQNFGVPSLRLILQFKPFNNSGAAAISLAVLGGAARVLLLGYDCQPAPDGRIHWHPDHPAPLSNARTMAVWPHKFQQVAAYAKKQGVPVLNATRSTALRCFERVALEDILEPAYA